MDPWSKVDYSRHIREASMVVEKLPEVIPPSGRVPGRSLLMLPILGALWQRNRGEIAKKVSVFRVFVSRRINRQRGAARGATRGPGAPPARPRGGRAPWPPGQQVGPPRSSFGDCRSFRSADFLYDFSRIFLAILIWGKPGTKRQQKTGTGTEVH